MNKKINYICSECGKCDIKWDAWASWNIDKQEYELDDTFEYAYCENCDGSCKVKEIEITNPNEEKI